MPLTDANATISGVAAGDQCGARLAGGGDVNGDDRADVAAQCASVDGDAKVALFFGPIEVGAYTYDAGDAVLNGAPGFGDNILLPVDLTGDSIDDLLVLEGSGDHVWLLAGFEDR